MTDTQPTMPQPEEPPRRLTRSTTDRLIGGVAGGLGRHLDVDPLAIRITFVILSFAGGLGLLAYLLCLAFVPTDDPSAPPLKWGLARTIGAGLLAVAALAILVPDWFWGPQLPLLLVAGAIVYLLLRMLRDDGGTHAGRVAARIAIGIVLAGARRGRLRRRGGRHRARRRHHRRGPRDRVRRRPGRRCVPRRRALADRSRARARAAAGRRRRDRPRRARHVGRPHVSSGDSRRACRRIRDGRGLVEGRHARRRAAARPDRPAARDRHGRDRGARVPGHLRHHRGRGRRRDGRRRRRRAGRHRRRRAGRSRRGARRAGAARDRGRRDGRGAGRRPRLRVGRAGPLARRRLRRARRPAPTARRAWGRHDAARRLRPRVADLGASS